MDRSITSPIPAHRPVPDVVLLPEGALHGAAARWLAAAIADSLAARGRCHLALSGGSTPLPLYRQLSGPPFAATIDWRHVEIWFADERAVPPHDAASNYRAIAGSLLDRVPVPSEAVHRMPAEHADLDAAAAGYARQLPAALDVLLLGIGAEGHTASLFPQSPALRESRKVVAVTVPAKPPRRLTITPPVIAAARVLAVLASGAAKADAVGRALADGTRPDDIPACLARRGTWFLDPAAGARVSATRPG